MLSFFLVWQWSSICSTFAHSFASFEFRYSKVGRPPLKKVSDRKASSRPGQAVNSCSSDPIGRPSK